MSFASYQFLFEFLPCAIAFVLVAERINRRRLLLPALIFVSAVFYGLGSMPHLLLLLTMIFVSWGVSWAYIRAQNKVFRLTLLLLGIGINLLSLTIWKYGHSIVESWNALGFAPIDTLSIIMPLGISFYAFQQIGYLLDLRRGKAQWMTLTNYLAFILFFPQLIAGPIVTEKRMRRQFEAAKDGIILEERLRLAVLGSAWFAIGLFKKVVLADGLGRIVTPLIEEAAFGSVTAVDAWLIGFAAPTRVYFDFCGYSDMAVGLALFFGIRLPANFNAPYRARTARQFWTRWHITFHHFVRDHLYGPMVRKTENWRFGAAISLMLAVALSSLWHGNTVQFLVWGVLVWISIVATGSVFSLLPDVMRKIAMLIITVGLFLTMGVLFTTPNLKTGLTVLHNMVLLGNFLGSMALDKIIPLSAVFAALIYVRNEISTQVLLESGRDHRDRHMFGWRPIEYSVNAYWVVFIAVLLVISFRYIGVSPPFVYFGI